MKPLFDMTSVAVFYGKVQALKSCGLRIHAGERVALVGSNGSGKSTLLRTLHGLVRPTLGRLQFDATARQAMLFQHPYMLRASAQSNVALGLWLQGMPWKEAKTHALRALERVGLLALAPRNAKALSGGQQQRLALARAWAMQPQVLLLDEPTASLDPGAKREVEALMAEFADAGMTLIFSSHNLGQVKRLASRVIYLEHGRLLADLPAHDFFNGPLPLEAEIFVKGELV
ncbi:phosphate ABC transporter ATP-binding protein [Polaromonas sp. UC242_47]|uniref:phosphate ABC transporter ATP-binding protein n=1 Tax=Polaromonas sp. UC242_47 TaxID=3374626 RepID=UPI0037BE1893